MPKLPWYFKAVYLFCLLAAVLPASAADVFQINDPTGKVGVRLVLRDSECTDKSVLEWLYDAILDDRRFKKAELEWEGENFGACYIEKDEQVYVIGSDKQRLRPIPKSAFHDEAI